MKYRAEIDGLRALAVVPVILFHAGFELFSGGFVGVDVFFVISGYLITTILIEDIENNRFSIVNFYERRARRILPALFFVMFVCIPFAWMWMLPSQMEDFSRSLVAVSLFASNILFWVESGYFAPAAEEYPLLHTWSLAVEEQYYLLFPIFLFLVWRFGKNRVFWMIVVFAAISLFLSEWSWRNHAAANFYLAPTRAWELFAGSIAAFVVQKRGVQASNAVSLLGLAAIIFAIFAYDENTPFPSIYALVPVIGVVLLVLFAEKATVTSRVLSTKYLVGIGLISYSTYLWHQPLFAFARIRSVDDPTDKLMIFLSLFSAGLGWLSWKFIEQPFRNRKHISRRKIVLITIVGISGFSLLGFTYVMFPSELTLHSDIVVNIDGFESRNGKERDGACATLEGVSQNEYCILGGLHNIRGALLGDSHAKMLWHPLNSHLNKLGLGVESYIGGNCPPIRNVYRRDIIKNTCYEYNSTTLDKIIHSKEIEFVILSGRWTLHIEKSRFDNGEGNEEGGVDAYLDVVEEGKRQKNIESVRQQKVLEQIENTIKELIDSGKAVFVVYPVPEVGFNVPQKLAKAELLGIDSYAITHSYRRFLSRNEKVRSLFQKLSHTVSDRLYFIDISENLCSKGSGRCFVLDDNSQLLYSDDNHLSNAGSNIVVEQMIATLRKLFMLPGSATWY